LRTIYGQLTDLYLQNHSLNTLSRCEMGLPLLERSLSLLIPWLIQLDLDATNRMNTRMNDILEALFRSKQNMAALTSNSNQFDVAEGHCQRSLAYSRRYGLEGEKKITMTFTALKTYFNLRKRQGDNPDALTLAEEGYQLVEETYRDSPHFGVHPQVQEAAGILINILISKGNYYVAESYAQVTYDNLRNKNNGINLENEALATGAYDLADVLFRQNENLIIAEKLARESLRIRSLIIDSNHHSVGRSCNLLAGILKAQDYFGDETRGL
jgi:hypothetical protein